MRKILLLVAMVVALAGAAGGEIIRTQHTDGTATVQSFRLLPASTSNLSGFIVWGKDGAAFWWKQKWGQTWLGWRYAVYANIDSKSDSLKVLPATEDTIYVDTKRD